MIPVAASDESGGDGRAPDDAYMARALELAALGLYTTDPNPRVGCVLVRDGAVIGEGWHVRAGEPHAEVVALRAVDGGARGATAYVTLEPCCHTGRTPPCADALIAAGIARVVCATVDPNPKVAGAGIERLRAAGIAVSSGLMQSAARELNPGFFSRFEQGRPLIRLKLAMSLDARTAPAEPGRRWITGEAARADVQTWRARSSAIVTGAGTVRADDPRLDVRLNYGPWIRQPLRALLDPDLTCPPSARLFHGGHALVFAAERAAATGPVGPASSDPVRWESADAGAPVRIVRVPRVGHALDLGRVIAELTALEANELFVECGARLAAAFLEADLVDELILYVAPMFLGTDAAPLAAFRASSVGALAKFEFRDRRMIDQDLRLILTSKRV